MEGVPRTIETSIATMTLVEKGFIEQRFKLGATIGRSGFEENRKVRFELAGETEYVMLTFIPKGFDLELNVATIDHFKPETDTQKMLAIAVVAFDSIGVAIAKVHFAHFPQVFQARVFNNETEARTWLAQFRPQ